MYIDNNTAVWAFIVLGIYVLWAQSTIKSWSERAKKVIDTDEYAAGVHRELEKQKSEIAGEAKAVGVRKALQTRREDLFKRLMEERSRTYPWVANIHSDILDAEAQSAAWLLESKQRPALRAAEQLKEFRDRVKDKLLAAKFAQYKCAVYESTFPFIPDLIEDAAAEELRAFDASDDTQDDPSQRFLSKDEWQKLSAAQRNQLALDRYLQGPMGSWRIGREYERFVGYSYEENGHDVSYFGALAGFDDLGRDLIVKRGADTLIVQCKYWSQFKSVHENTIFQLFGTTVDYLHERRLLSGQSDIFAIMEKAGVQPVLITSTKVTERARYACHALRVKLVESHAFKKDYPRIKCNINGGSRIYHLPFDQQYDRVKIEVAKGEMYVRTVEEAERAGFRRAFKWKGSTQ